MSNLTIILIALFVIVALSLALYLAGFRWKILKIKWLFGEAELERTPAAGDEKPSPPASPATSVDQEATKGGVIRKSPIQAPADSGAQVTQKAAGDKSRIDDSGITLE